MGIIEEIAAALATQDAAMVGAAARAEEIRRIAGSLRIPEKYYQDAESLSASSEAEADAVWGTRNRLRLLLRALQEEEADWRKEVSQYAPRWCKVHSRNGECTVDLIWGYQEKDRHGEFEDTPYLGRAARWERADPLPSDLAQSLIDFFE